MMDGGSRCIRVGPQHQAVVPKHAERPASSRGQSAQLVWKAHSSPCSSRDIDRFVAALRPSLSVTSEATALAHHYRFRRTISKAV